MKIQSTRLLERRSFFRIAAIGSGAAAVLGSSASSLRGAADEAPSSPNKAAMTNSPQHTTSRYWRNTDPKLDATLETIEARIPNKRIMLGCYMYDFATRTPVSVDLMKLQCEKGLQWLRQGRIEGMIFLGNTVADFDFPSVEWTREWIQRVGDEKV